MPSHEQVAAARAKGLPYGVLSGLTAVTATAAQTSVAVATADANTQTGAYVQADVQSIATLANALKVQGNAERADIANLRTKLEELRTACISAGIVL